MQPRAQKALNVAAEEAWISIKKGVPHPYVAKADAWLAAHKEEAEDPDTVRLRWLGEICYLPEERYPEDELLS